MAYRSTSTASPTTNTPSITGALPSGAVASDVLVAFVGGQIGANRLPISAAGWTAVDTSANSIFTSSAVFWALGSVAGFTFSNANGELADMHLHIHAFSGRNTSDPIAGVYAYTISPDNGIANRDAPSVTARSGDDIALMWCSGMSNSTFGTVPTNYVDRANTVSAVSSLYTATRDAVTAGATGLQGRTTSTIYNNSIQFTVAIAASGGPTVSTVTTPGTTEAGNMVFTASLSGATSGTTNYAFGLTGTATAGTDYTSPLTGAMCSNGVTVVGSDFVVPTAVSSWTVTIPTTADTTDETNETIILTIGGTASTGGTITDDDPVPAWSVSDASPVTSGSPAIFTISADRASALTQNLTLGFIDGTRVGGVGYDNTITNPDLSSGVTISAGVLTIPAGVTSFTVSVGTV